MSLSHSSVIGSSNLLDQDVPSLEQMRGASILLVLSPFSLPAPHARCCWILWPMPLPPGVGAQETRGNYIQPTSILSNIQMIRMWGDCATRMFEDASSLKAPTLQSRPLQATLYLDGSAYAAAGKASGAMHMMTCCRHTRRIC